MFAAVNVLLNFKHPIALPSGLCSTSLVARRGKVGVRDDFGVVNLCQRRRTAPALVPVKRTEQY